MIYWSLGSSSSSPSLFVISPSFEQQFIWFRVLDCFSSPYHKSLVLCLPFVLIPNKHVDLRELPDSCDFFAAVGNPLGQIWKIELKPNSSACLLFLGFFFFYFKNKMVWSFGKSVLILAVSSALLSNSGRCFRRSSLPLSLSRFSFLF